MTSRPLRLLLAFLALFPALTFAQQTISLNGIWDFWLPVKLPKTTVTVPHTYNIMPGLEDYAGEAWYSRTLPLKSAANVSSPKLRSTSCANSCRPSK